jgi:AAA domain
VTGFSFDRKEVASEDEPVDDHDPVSTKALGTILKRSELGALPKVQSLVDGLMSEPVAVVLIGAYGLGKTVLVHSLAACIATGQPWLGRETRRRRALVVVGEGAAGLDDRICAWETAWNQGRPVDLTFMVKPGSLASLNTWIRLTEYAVDREFGFVALDTFSSLAPDADEVKGAPLVMRRLSDLSTAINGTALLVHHPGWSDGGRARGGSQFEANADEVLLLTGTPSEPLVSLTRKKVKDGPSGGTIWLRRKEQGRSVILEHARPAEIEAPQRSRLLAILDAYADAGATGPQLAAECEVDDKARSAFYKALGKLRSDGQVRATGTRRTLRYYLTEHAPKDAG